MTAGVSPIRSHGLSTSCRPCRVIIVRYISGDDVEDVEDDAVE